jgi:hypothetical protein
MFEVCGLINLLTESADQFRTRISSYDVPHFRLSVPGVSFGSKFIIRVNLYGEIISRINKFNQDRKFIAEALINAVANQIAHVNFHQFVQVVACQKTIHNGCLVSLNPRHYPGFTAIGQRREIDSQHRLDLTSSPDFVF